jgi:very-short-patch-repair endonuclease
VLMYDRSALSRSAAAWAHGLRRQLGRVHLSSMTQRRSSEIAQLHRVADLEIEVIRGLPCTTLAQTFLDCAATLPRDQVEAMLHRAEELRTFDLGPILPLLTEKRGSPALRQVLALHRANQEYTRSELERRFAKLIRDAGLPTPEYNVFVLDLWVDAFWPHQRVAVELDGGTHRTASAQDRDTRRNAILTAAGYIPLRYTWGQVTTDPAHVLRTLRAVL